MGFHWLFGLNALGFLASAALVLSVLLPSPRPATTEEGTWGRMTRGARIYLSTPRLRGLLALNLSVAARGTRHGRAGRRRPPLAARRPRGVGPHHADLPHLRRDGAAAPAGAGTELCAHPRQAAIADADPSFDRTSQTVTSESEAENTSQPTIDERSVKATGKTT